MRQTLWCNIFSGVQDKDTTRGNIYKDNVVSGKRCRKSEFTCGDHRSCVGRHLVCDNVADCADSSDEQNCGEI